MNVVLDLSRQNIEEAFEQVKKLDGFLQYDVYGIPHCLISFLPLSHVKIKSFRIYHEDLSEKERKEVYDVSKLTKEDFDSLLSKYLFLRLENFFFLKIYQSYFFKHFNQVSNPIVVVDDKENVLYLNNECVD